MKLQKISIAAVCILLSLSSCNEYMDINENPNLPSESLVGAPSIFQVQLQILFVFTQEI